MGGGQTTPNYNYGQKKPAKLQFPHLSLQIYSIGGDYRGLGIIMQQQSLEAECKKNQSTWWMIVLLICM